MAKMEQWAGESVHLTYRGVGSSTGKKEYLAGSSDFGCAELPVTENEKAAVPSRTVLHLPLVLGAMSAFHSIPSTYTGTSGLELSPCLLARIFSRNITHWNDPALREGETINLGLASVTQPIVVFHRHKGSSTTNFFTRYLHESTRIDCPSAWTLGWGAALTYATDVKKNVTGTWDPSGACDEAGARCVEGSGGMSKGLENTPYAIGYIDSGHGLSDGHSEVKLKNLDGNYLDSAMAGEAGVMAAVTAATAAGNMPITATGNYESVNLINQAGNNTWPIVAISYLLVDLDQRGKAHGKLLKFYLNMMMDREDGGQKIAGKYNFFMVPDATHAQNLGAIAAIQTDPGTDYMWESSTNSTIGSLSTTFSIKRQTHLLRMIESHEGKIAAITGTSGSLTKVQQVLKEGHETSVPLEMHGSGTTNPSKMIWKMMATLKGMAIRPLHLSYRAIGSSSGIKEFKAGNSHFGSAEIPLTAQDKIDMSGDSSNPAQVLQLPLVLGAMSSFHSVPGVSGLHLTPCVLAKIFSRQITQWDDAEIRSINAGLDLPAKGIIVLHRKKGSSTTNFFTKYLHESTRTDCPSAWTLGWGASLTLQSDVGKGSVTGTWGADVPVTPAGGGQVTVQGSGRMSSYLSGNNYAIGYIDAGHGHEDGLMEIQLKNGAGVYMDSKMAGAAGIMATANAATYPASSLGDWTAVSLLNVNCPTCWPIVAISYLFVEKDLTRMGETGAAVKAFLEYSMSSETGYSSSKGGQLFASDFSFVKLPDNLITLNKAGINMITLAPSVVPFQFEWSTDVIVGPQRNTLSCKGIFIRYLGVLLDLAFRNASAAL
eukprot:COSAG01_NODE_3223_length_6394_cov_10.166005_4_plen_823_part_01